MGIIGSKGIYINTVWVWLAIMILNGFNQRGALQGHRDDHSIFSLQHVWNGGRATSPLHSSPPHVPLSKHRVIVFSKDLLCLFSLAHNLWLDSERLPTVPIENGVSDLLHYFLEKPKICFLFQKKNSMVICKNEKRTNRTRLFYEILEDNP